MKMPTSLNILGLKFTVTNDSVDSPRDPDYYGTIRYVPQEIRLSPTMLSSRRGEVLLHEIIHGIDDASCLKLSEPKVSRLSRGLWAVLQANPKLGEYLCELVSKGDTR